MRHTFAVALLLVVTLFASLAPATPEYAERTSRPCAACHRDPAGGGPLTPTGEGFVANDHRWPSAGLPAPAAAEPKAAHPALRAVRLGLGFVHLSTAIIWFGTIFYVHLILRPKYALGGLPKAEVRLAWGCMVLLGVTGVPLTYLRFHTLHGLLESHSGWLLLAKIGLYCFLVCSAAVVTLFVGPGLRRVREQSHQKDGREGRPAWVQVGDTLYDVSQSAKWKDGSHFRRHQAGGDLTDSLGQAPHGLEKLAAFPSWPAPSRGDSLAPVVRVFYVMAYLNLFVALGVLIIISLWRWG